MRILRNYLLKEFIGPFLLTLGLLSFVMIVVGNLKKIADLVINKGVDIFSIFKLFLLMTPYMVTYALPISILVATLMSLGRLSSDNEIIAIRASGINLFKLILPLIILSLILSLGLALFNDRAASYAHYEYRKTLIQIGIKNPTAAFEEGVFINSFEKYILFIYKVDQKHNRLLNVRIYEPQEDDKPTRTIVAKSGEFITVPEKNTVKLKLMDGTSDEPDPNNPTNFYKLNFKTYFMNLNPADAQKAGKKIEKKEKEMTIQELRNQVKKLRSKNINAGPLLVEIHEKLTLAFSCLIFVLMGAPLAIITRRREKSINIGIAILIIVVYYPLLIGCESLGMEGVINPVLAMWIPNIIFGSLGTVLTYRLCAS
ncbi:MAG: LptF/LptG family permease [Candidatus Omnitrophota bacterium]